MAINRDLTNRRIRELRKEKGLTQNDLAQKLHVKRQIISYYETSRMPNAEDLILLADELGTTTDYLLGRTDTKSTDAEAQAIIANTGLSEGAVLKLIETNTDSFFDEDSCVLLSFVSNLICSPELSKAVKNIVSAERTVRYGINVLLDGRDCTFEEKGQVADLCRSLTADIYEAKDYLSKCVEPYLQAHSVDKNKIDEATSPIIKQFNVELNKHFIEKARKEFEKNRR